MCPIPNGYRDRTVSLYSCKIVDKEILRIVSNIGIYFLSAKDGALYLVQYIFENSTVNINPVCNSCDDMACCSSECILTFFIWTITSTTRSRSSSRLSTFVLYTLLFLQHHKQIYDGAQYGGSEGAKSKLLYSAIALSQKPFGIGHMYLYTFLLRMADTMDSQNIDISSWDTLIYRV